MNRSRINQAIATAIEFFARHSFRLPPFAFWTAHQWKSIGHEADEIRTRRLGWDVTDYGEGRFDEAGLVLFTLRNGLVEDPHNRKPFAEKIIMVGEGQLSPWCCHHRKVEDLINRSGGRLVCELYNSTRDGGLADTPVFVSCDGVIVETPPGGKITLAPGQSITLPPGLYHQFSAEKGAGAVMLGEISSVVPADNDNRFLKQSPALFHIDEDEPPALLLCREYPPAK